MVYDELLGAICRQATEKDYNRILEILLPFIRTESGHSNFQDMEVRTAKKLTMFFIKQGLAMVVEENGVIVGMYTGRENRIGNIANVGSLHATILLLKVALCNIQNLFTEAHFQVANDKIRKIYESIKTPNGKACSIDELGNGIVSLEAKQEILNVYNHLKG